MPPLPPPRLRPGLAWTEDGNGNRYGLLDAPNEDGQIWVQDVWGHRLLMSLSELTHIKGPKDPEPAQVEENGE